MNISAVLSHPNLNAGNNYITPKRVSLAATGMLFSTVTWRAFLSVAGNNYITLERNVTKSHGEISRSVDNFNGYN